MLIFLNLLSWPSMNLWTFVRGYRYWIWGSVGSRGGRWKCGRSIWGDVVRRWALIAERRFGNLWGSFSEGVTGIRVHTIIVWNNSTTFYYDLKLKYSIKLIKLLHIVFHLQNLINAFLSYYRSITIHLKQKSMFLNCGPLLFHHFVSYICLIL